MAAPIEEDAKTNEGEVLAQLGARRTSQQSSAAEPENNSTAGFSNTTVAEFKAWLDAHFEKKKKNNNKNNTRANNENSLSSSDATAQVNTKQSADRGSAVLNRRLFQTPRFDQPATTNNDIISQNFKFKNNNNNIFKKVNNQIINNNKSPSSQEQIRQPVSIQKSIINSFSKIEKSIFSSIKTVGIKIKSNKYVAPIINKGKIIYKTIVTGVSKTYNKILNSKTGQLFKKIGKNAAKIISSSLGIFGILLGGIVKGISFAVGGIVKAVQFVFGGIGKIVNTVLISPIQKIFQNKDVTEALKKARNITLSALLLAFLTSKDGMYAAGFFAGKLLKFMKTACTIGIGKLVSGITSALAVVGIDDNDLSQIAETLGNTVRAVGDGISTAFHKIVDFFKILRDPEQRKTALSHYWEKTKESLNERFPAVVKLLNLLGSIAPVFWNILLGILKPLAGILKFMANIPGPLVTAIRGLANPLDKLVGIVVAGVIGATVVGIRSIFNWVHSKDEQEVITKITIADKFKTLFGGSTFSEKGAEVVAELEEIYEEKQESGTKFSIVGVDNKSGQKSDDGTSGGSSITVAPNFSSTSIQNVKNAIENINTNSTNITALLTPNQAAASNNGGTLDERFKAIKKLSSGFLFTNDDIKDDISLQDITVNKFNNIVKYLPSISVDMTAALQIPTIFANTAQHDKINKTQLEAFNDNRKNKMFGVIRKNLEKKLLSLVEVVTSEGKDVKGKIKNDQYSAYYAKKIDIVTKNKINKLLITAINTLLRIDAEEILPKLVAKKAFNEILEQLVFYFSPEELHELVNTNNIKFIQAFLNNSYGLILYNTDTITKQLSWGGDDSPNKSSEDVFSNKNLLAVQKKVYGPEYNIQGHVKNYLDITNPNSIVNKLIFDNSDGKKEKSLDRAAETKLVEQIHKQNTKTIRVKVETLKETQSKGSSYWNQLNVPKEYTDTAFFSYIPYNYTPVIYSVFGVINPENLGPGNYLTSMYGTRMYSPDNKRFSQAISVSVQHPDAILSILNQSMFSAESGAGVNLNFNSTGSGQEGKFEKQTLTQLLFNLLMNDKTGDAKKILSNAYNININQTAINRLNSRRYMINALPYNAILYNLSQNSPKTMINNISDLADPKINKKLSEIKYHRPDRNIVSEAIKQEQSLNNIYNTLESPNIDYIHTANSDIKNTIDMEIAEWQKQDNNKVELDNDRLMYILTTLLAEV